MRSLNLDAPINSLSLGNVSLNFLRELHKREIQINLFSQNLDLSAYDKIDEELKSDIADMYNNRFKNFSKDTPTLKVWHINGSEKQIGKNQYLYTFYEVDSPTVEEINIVKAQKHVFFSSSEAASLFKKCGCDNVSYVPLGFDPDINNFDGKNNLLEDDVIHFSLIGKIEKRKNTQAILHLWNNKFGNDPRYTLTCLIGNPFLEQEHIMQSVLTAFGGEKPTNVNFLPKLEKNSEVNALMASADINLSGISNGEGWNLPAFNSTAMGKWSIVTDCSGHKDWANEKNSILIPAVNKQPCYDNIFFKEGGSFNQGNYYLPKQEDVNSALDRAVGLAKKENTEGLKLQKDFTYGNSIDMILDVIYSK